MFARLWNITLAELHRFADLSDEDRLLLSCHIVVVVIVSVLSVPRQVVGPSSHLTAQPGRYLYKDHSGLNTQHCITTFHLALAAHSKSRSAKRPRHGGCAMEGWAVFCLQTGRRTPRTAITDRRRSENRGTWLSLRQCFDCVHASLSAGIRI